MPFKFPPTSPVDLQKPQQESQQLNDLLRELEITKSQLADVKKYAEAKDQELKDMRLAEVEKEENAEKARGISSKSNILSTAAIIQTIDILNVEIFRAAVSLGKMMHKTDFGEGQEQTTQIVDKGRAMIGKDMVALLAKESLKSTPHLNPLLVQVVLQIAITNWCKSAVSSWKPGNSSFSDLLEELYSKIRQFEDPIFSYRWRAVTRAQLQISSDDWTQNLRDGLLSVLIIAGWSTRKRDQQSQFEKQFPPIFEAVLDLRKALGEDITSMDMEVATVEPGTILDPTSMDDAWGSSLTKNRALATISGTTGLGLQKIVMKPSGQGFMSQAEIVYRPRVVLECTVEEALSPQPPLKPLKIATPAEERVSSEGNAINQETEQKADSPKKLPSGRADASTGDGANPHDNNCSLVYELEAVKSQLADAKTLLELKSDAQVDRLIDDNCSLAHELEAVKLQLADAKTLSEVRGMELKGAQAFLFSADTLSTTDVVQKVSHLNEEIFQAAAFLGEMLQITECRDRTQDQVTEAFEKARWMVGEHLASILAADSVNLRTDLNPLLVQVVLQISITTWCRVVVSSWKPSDPPVADFLSALYSEIRQIEDQSVSGRWRSITRTQLRTLSDDLAENLMSGLLSVLIIAGWSTREPDPQHQFQRRLPPIFKAVQDLRKALGEDVTSMDMEVVTIEAGDAFNPGYMEDGYGDARASAGTGKKVTPEKVYGTTGLGLHKVTMKRTEWGSMPQAEMVLFPKVALDGTLKEAMDPAPAPARRRKKVRHDRGSGNGGARGGGGGAPATGSGTGVAGIRK